MYSVWLLLRSIQSRVSEVSIVSKEQRLAQIYTSYESLLLSARCLSFLSLASLPGNEIDRHNSTVGEHGSNTHFVTGDGGFINSFVSGFGGLMLGRSQQALVS